MTRRTKEDRIRGARERAKRVIVALVTASKGKLVGKLRLYKAFYRAHLEYFSATGLDLTGYPMVHMQNGPGIDNAQELIDELREDGRLVEKVGTPRRPNERVYHLVGPAHAEEDEHRDRAIKTAIAWANSLDENQLKEQSHNRSWRETSLGEAQNIFLDLVPEDQVDAFRKDIEGTVAALAQAATGL